MPTRNTIEPMGGLAGLVTIIRSRHTAGRCIGSGAFSPGCTGETGSRAVERAERRGVWGDKLRSPFEFTCLARSVASDGRCRTRLDFRLLGGKRAYIISSSFRVYLILIFLFLHSLHDIRERYWQQMAGLITFLCKNFTLFRYLDFLPCPVFVGAPLVFNRQQADKGGNNAKPAYFHPCPLCSVLSWRVLEENSSYCRKRNAYVILHIDRSKDKGCYRVRNQYVVSARKSQRKLRCNIYTYGASSR